MTIHALQRALSGPLPSAGTPARSCDYCFLSECSYRAHCSIPHAPTSSITSTFVHSDETIFVEEISSELLRSLMQQHDALVIGAGPGGLAVVAGLLDADLSDIVWIDRSFKGGRLNELYREISSNTKVGIYLDAINSSATCRQIIDDTPRPNAVSRLEGIDREKTVELSFAGDLIEMLIEGILKTSRVQKVVEEVDEARCEGGRWQVRLCARAVSAPRLFLCTGSHPSPDRFHHQYNDRLQVLNLDECMRRSRLPDLLPAQSTVAIIGNSHSGILACRNMYELAQTGKRRIKVYNFRRRPVRYAIYRKDGIVYDNTGLKGDTADWAKQVMEHDPDPDRLQEIDLSDGEADTQYREHLPKCSHIVYATGYEPNALPKLYLNDERIDRVISFDMQSSSFKRLPGEAPVPGLYGAGIAFPEKVADPEGHIEAAVGVAKFFKFTERIKESWAQGHAKVA